MPDVPGLTEDEAATLRTLLSKAAETPGQKGAIDPNAINALIALLPQILSLIGSIVGLFHKPAPSDAPVEQPQ